MVVDTQGLPLAAIAHAADVQDRDGGVLLMATLLGMSPFLRRLRADREEKRVTRGRDICNEEQLDPANPNQRGLSGALCLLVHPAKSRSRIATRAVSVIFTGAVPPTFAASRGIAPLMTSISLRRRAS